MTNRKPRPSTVTPKFLKSSIMEGLKKSEELIIAGLKSHEEAVAEWKKTVLPKFETAVREFTGKDSAGYPTSFSLSKWDYGSPENQRACNNYNVQRINLALGRIDAMLPEEDGSIRLRSDDAVFELINLASCL